ncbi:uncharacterized protein LOC126376075 [Pectinophora gossypiella]|uniref:MD-2-related lipid-recognition domain-containing protein n=2 Tax=Pectinophora gossypiella TaxID=13191 RepID=A0A1E1WD61_PECGO|nr:uncharacterized protein LOC126376075 [Pectinophora gossypiella]
MLRVLVVSCLLVLAAAQESTNVAQCVRNAGDLPLHTWIEGCVTPPCVLPQLQDVVLHIVFRAPRLITEMRTLATAYMGILPIPYDLREDSVTCNFLTNTYCPVLATEVVQYTLRMYIESIFPVGTAVTLEFRVVDRTTGANVPMLCIRVPISIAPPVNSLSAAVNDTLTGQ